MRLPWRSSARTLDLERPRHPAADVRDAQAAFPAFDDLVADDLDLRIDDGNRLASRRGRRDRDARRRCAGSACTCGAARPTPEYSRIVSIMSSMSCCSGGVLELAASRSAALFCRSTGCPIRATFRIDMRQILYRSDAYRPVRAQSNDNDRRDAHARSRSAVPFCPVCGGALEPRVLKATEPKRLVCTQRDLRICVLSRSEDRGRHGHSHAGRSDRARPARDRAGLRQVGVSGRLCRSRRGDHAGGDPRGARRSRGSTCASIG